MSMRKQQAPGSVAMLIAAASLIAAPRAAADLQLTRLIGTGDPAPGLPGATMEPVGGRAVPQLDNQGNIAVGVRLSGVGPGIHNATLYGRPGNFNIVLRDHAPAPGLEPREVAFSDTFALGLDGAFHFSGLVLTTDMTAVEPIIWTQTPSGPEIVLRAFDQPPGVPEPGAWIGAPILLHAGPGGQIMFTAGMGGPGIDDSNREGLWTQSVPGGPLSLLAREGDPAPGLPDDVRFRGAADISTFYKVNRAGEVAFRAFLQGPGIDGTNESAIWSGTPGNLSVTARAGDPAPGAGPGVNFASFAELSLNDAGEHFFYSALAGENVTPENDLALWHGVPENLQLIAREGDHAPGMDPGVVFESFRAKNLNESGLALGLGAVRGPGIDESNDAGLWLGRPGALDLILEEYAQVPGADADVRFDLDFAVTAMNARGDVVILTEILGTGVDEDSDRGIWARVAATGEWLKVVREGDVLDGRVVGGATIDAVDVLYGARPLNDAGMLIFKVSFADASDAIYSVLVPEPASIAALCMGAAMLARRRRFSQNVTLA